jgi:hypothetical protein
MCPCGGDMVAAHEAPERVRVHGEDLLTAVLPLDLFTRCGGCGRPGLSQAGREAATVGAAAAAMAQAARWGAGLPRGVLGPRPRREPISGRHFGPGLSQAGPVG